MRRLIFLLTAGALTLPASAYAQGPRRPNDLPGQAYAAVNAAPDLMAGIVFEAGAFDLSSNPEAMILGAMPFPKGVAFIHDKLTYYGPYTDPATGVKGWLYSLMIGTNKRFFLVGQDGIAGLSSSQRWVLEFSDTGAFLRTFQGTFANK
jgi:hypothetical protein